MLEKSINIDNEIKYSQSSLYVDWIVVFKLFEEYEFVTSVLFYFYYNFILNVIIIILLSQLIKNAGLTN